MLILKLKAFLKLGLVNLWHVGCYRLLLKAGLHPVQKIRRKPCGSTFFDYPQELSKLAASHHWQASSLYFGLHSFKLGDNPPDWHVNPFNGCRVSNADRPWWLVPDFASGAGDIKTIWEASRFDWVVAFAQRAAVGEPDQIHLLNYWLADWNKKNRAYRGPNWKCGQEASIRVMHLLLAARILRQDEAPRSELVDFIEAHLARIASTVRYAIGQDNNHATSEAAALFVAGSWLHNHGVVHGRRWSQLGRLLLENCVARLIDPTGSFSQHSVNYHRLMLDTLCLAELWRRWLDQPKFSIKFYERAEAATRWLSAMIDPVTGDFPNIGANDGANLLPLTDANHRDCRPSLLLASVLFALRCYPTMYEGSSVTLLRWLGLRTPAKSNRKASEIPQCFQASGFMVLGSGPWRVVFRYPEYRFRPSHCDQLHVDLWLNSQNWLRDAGSYSYNTDAETTAYFTGASGHNTIEFDQRDAMPLVDKFIRGAWLKAHSLQMPQRMRDGAITAAAAYRDYHGASHHRQLVLGNDELIVTDTVSGFTQEAVLRWRLPSGDWYLDGQKLIAGEIAIHIETDMRIERLALVDGWESRYYLHRELVKVLEVCVRQSGRIITSVKRAI